MLRKSFFLFVFLCNVAKGGEILSPQNQKVFTDLISKITPLDPQDIRGTGGKYTGEIVLWTGTWVNEFVHEELFQMSDPNFFVLFSKGFNPFDFNPYDTYGFDHHQGSKYGFEWTILGEVIGESNGLVIIIPIIISASRFPFARVSYLLQNYNAKKTGDKLEYDEKSDPITPGFFYNSDYFEYQKVGFFDWVSYAIPSKKQVTNTIGMVSIIGGCIFSIKFLHDSVFD